MRKFMAIDGTFLKARFVQTLLFAVGIDGNGLNLRLISLTSHWLVNIPVPVCLTFTFVTSMYIAPLCS